MAYQTRQRDPLLDSNMQAAIEKRGAELIGIALIVAAVLAAMMIGSYTPEDPSWLSATDAPVQNWLGRFGASLVAPLFMIVGWGAWGIAIILGAWGLRLAIHRGKDRMIGRLIFAPIAIALASVYASTLAPGVTWTHSFGLGGLFGDTVLGVILTILPAKAAFGVKLMSLLTGVGILVMGAFVLGFTIYELRRAGRFLLIGLIVLYSFILKLLGRGAWQAARGASALAAQHQARRDQSRQERELYAAEEAVAVPEPTAAERVAAVVRAAPAMPTSEPAPMMAAEPEPYAVVEENPGFLARMPSLLKRQEPPVEMPENELVEPYLSVNIDPPQDDARIKAKISDVIKSRVRSPLTASMRAEPSLTAGRGPKPLLINPVAQPTAAVAQPTAAVAQLPAEPPVMAAPFVEAMPEPEFVEPENVVATPHAPIPQAHVPQPVPMPEVKSVVQHPVKRVVQPSKQAKAEAQPALQFEERPRVKYEHPPLSLLASPSEVTRHHLSDEALEENARMLESVLDDYGVKGEIVSVRPGPVVTMYELEPAPGLKASRVIGLADDIARSMSALSARVSTVPGRSVIGIELPNENREMCVLREVLAARDFGDSNMKLPLALGKDIGGDPIVANLAKMPHLLIAGTTGSGKSVAINTMILSLLYKLTPEECRMIMIDPKMLELSVYDGIPHLLSPVVTDPKKAVVALKWTVGEMEERYRKMSKMGVRNIDGYNSRVADALAKDEMFSRTVQTGFDDDTGEPVFETEEFAPEKMPYIVVIVDEMADLMMVAGKEIEACIQRLAQMARASGIHLIMATQRPSVDVITGTIKANFPTRISFQVTSKIDSRTILGEQGAEQLLGMGDMLYMAGGAKITRVHGPFCSDEEVEEIVNYLKAYGPPEYFKGVVDGPDEDKGSEIDMVLGLGGNTDGEDALYDTAVAIVIKDRKCSTSYIQRKLAIGYNKAARLVEQMEDQGLVSAANHVGKREILVPEQQ
jgi:S-DNA-T family DNA segregation ATPase FtsK/SpoIIIE